MALEKHVDALIPAYALGCLDDEEATLVAGHIIDCAACREALQHYQTVVDGLALATPDAVPSDTLPARLRQRIQPVAATNLTAESPWRTMLQLLRRPAGLWGAVSAVIILLLITGNITLWSFANRPQPTPTPRPNVMRTIPLFPTDAVPEAHGMIVIGLEGYHGALVVEDLTPLEPDQQYQFWLADGENRINGGTFTVDPSGYKAITISAPRPLIEYSGFGITIEPIAGSDLPLGDRVLRWGTERGR